MTQKEIYLANLEEKRKRGLRSVSFTSSKIMELEKLRQAASQIREACSKLSPQDKADLEASARKFIVEQ